MFQGLEQKLVGLLDQIPEYCVYFDADFKYRFGNRAYQNLLGKSNREMLGLKASTLMGGEIFGKHFLPMQPVLTGTTTTFESTLVIGNRTLSLSIEAIPDLLEDGKIEGCFFIAKDIGERKAAEAARLKSEARYRLLFNSMAEGVAINEVVMDEKGEIEDYLILEVNAAFERHAPYSKVEATGNRATKLYHMSREFIREWWSRHSLLTETVYTEYFHQPSLRWFSIATTPREGLRFITIFTDITQSKAAETALRESAVRFDELAERSGTVAWEIDAAGFYSYVSKGSRTIYGYLPEEMVGRMKLLELIPASGQEKVQTEILDAVSRKEPFRNQVNPIVTKDGRQLLVSTNGFPILESDGTLKGYRGSDTDITLRRKMEESLRNAQKLDSLGVLAGGIAHDFNNLLGGIFGYTELALKKSTENQVQAYLTQTMNSLDRARALTHQLLTFAKGGMPTLKTDSLTPFLQEITSFALSGSNTSAQFEMAQDLWKVVFDRNQLAQVIDNIVINAKQSMGGGGIIQVTAGNIRLTPRQPADLEAGNYVLISIKDQGPGIAQDILPRIFDPFFTTKALGQGLGLATSYSIIKRHKGLIEVESTLNQGTCFHIYLPADKAAPPSVTEPQSSFHTGTGQILVMDDEMFIRETMSEMLSSMGYDVVTATNGSEALAETSRLAHSVHLQEKGAGLVCIFLDLTIKGGMGGREAALKLKALVPRIPIIACTGYAEDEVIADPEKFGFLAGMQKPFRKADLEKVLARALGQPQT